MAYPNTERVWNLPTVTIRATNAPVPMMLLEAAAQAGVSIVVPTDIENESISLDIVDAPAQTAFEIIASEFNRVPDLDGNVVRFVDADDANTDYVVFGPQFTRSDDFEETLKTLLGDGPSIAVIGDRTVVTGDGQTIRKAQALRDTITIGPDGWILELRIVEISRTLAKTIGLEWDLTAGVELAAGGNAGETARFLTGASAGVLASIIATATAEKTHSHVHHTASLYLLEGETTSVLKGASVPIPNFQTSPEGTVRNTGFTYVDTGLNIEATGRRVPGGLRLDLKPEVSTVTGFVEQAPILVTSTVEVSAIVKDGDWLLLTGLDTLDETDSRSGLPLWDGPLSKRLTTTETESIFVIMLRATRIYSGSNTP